MSRLELSHLVDGMERRRNLSAAAGSLLLVGSGALTVAARAALAGAFHLTGAGVLALGGNAPGGNFLGDPGLNQYMVGWSLGPGNNNLTEMRANPGYPDDSKISVIHDYSGNTTGVDTMRLDRAINAGFTPSQSVKFSAYSAASIAAGTRDGAIDTAAAACHARRPARIHFSYWHEPGGDFGTGTAPTAAGMSQAMKDYVDAWRRIVMRFRAAGVTNVVFVPILETPWNFAGNGVPGAPVSGSPTWMDFRMWHPDWDWRNGGWFDDLTMDLFGVDLYTPMIGGSTYRQFATDMSYVQIKLDATGAPDWDLAVYEFGMNNDAIGHNWPDYGTQMRDFMKANRVKLVCKWDNSTDVGRYSFGPLPVGHTDTSDFDADGTKLIGWNTVINGGVKVAA